jgi:hypothetical protein
MKYVLRAVRSHLHLCATMQRQSMLSQYAKSNQHQVLPSLKPRADSKLVHLLTLNSQKHYGQQAGALHAVFQATVVPIISYAPPARSRYATPDDEARLEALLRRSTELRTYHAESEPTVANMCAEADSRLFSTVLSNEILLLRPLLPPPRDPYYLLRTRPNHGPFHTAHTPGGD